MTGKDEDLDEAWEEDSDEREDLDSLVDECGLQPGPVFQCDHAGTEYCQFRCPWSPR